MSRHHRIPPLERLIQRALTNGIKSVTGLGDRIKPGDHVSKLATYTGNRMVFLTLLQADAAQLERRFDQGAHAEEFAQIVADVAQAMAKEAP